MFMVTTFARPQSISIKTETYEIDNHIIGQFLTPRVKLGLRDLFDLFDLDPKASFKIEGEQIDGAFTFDNVDYLFEGMVKTANRA